MPDQRKPDVVVPMSEGQATKLAALNNAAQSAAGTANAYLEAIIDSSDALPKDTPLENLEVADGEVRLWFPAPEQSDEVEE